MRRLRRKYERRNYGWRCGCLESGLAHLCCLSPQFVTPPNDPLPNEVIVKNVESRRKGLVKSLQYGATGIYMKRLTPTGKRIIGHYVKRRYIEDYKKMCGSVVGMASMEPIEGGLRAANAIDRHFSTQCETVQFYKIVDRVIFSTGDCVKLSCKKGDSIQPTVAITRPEATAKMERNYVKYWKKGADASNELRKMFKPFKKVKVPFDWSTIVEEDDDTFKCPECGSTKKRAKRHTSASMRRRIIDSDTEDDSETDDGSDDDDDFDIRKSAFENKEQMASASSIPPAISTSATECSSTPFITSAPQSSSSSSILESLEECVALAYQIPSDFFVSEDSVQRQPVAEPVETALRLRDDGYQTAARFGHRSAVQHSYARASDPSFYSVVSGRKRRIAFTSEPTKKKTRRGSNKGRGRTLGAALQFGIRSALE